MDILKASNIERLLFFLANQEPEPVRQWISERDSNGKFTLPTEVQERLASEEFASETISDQEILREIQKSTKEFQKNPIHIRLLLLRAQESTLQNIRCSFFHSALGKVWHYDLESSSFRTITAKDRRDDSSASFRNNCKAVSSRFSEPCFSTNTSAYHYHTRNN